MGIFSGISTRWQKSSSTVSRSNWNLEVLVFDERGKPEYPEKNLSEQSRVVMMMMMIMIVIMIIIILQ